MALENIIFVVFSHARKIGLNWSLEAAFASYTSFCQLQLFFIVEVHFTRLEIESALEKKKVTCECDVFMNTIL